jgi:hypothetical protein
MNTKISDKLRLAASKASADIVTAATTAYVSASGARRFAAALSAKALADTKKVTVQLKQAQSSAGLNAKNLGAAVEHTASGAETDVTAWAEAQASDLDTANGFGFIAVTVSSDNSAAVPAAVVLLTADNRFDPA